MVAPRRHVGSNGLVWVLKEVIGPRTGDGVCESERSIVRVYCACRRGVHTCVSVHAHPNTARRASTFQKEKQSQACVFQKLGRWASLAWCWNKMASVNQM